MTKQNHRIEKLQRLLKKLRVDALIIEDAVNLYYLTGLELSAGRLIVSEEQACLIVDGRYFERCSRINLPVVLAGEKMFQNILLERFPKITSIGFADDTTSYKQYVDLQKEVDKIATSTQRKFRLESLESPLQAMRMIKEEAEILLLKQAAKLGNQGLDHVYNILQEGITEREAALELEIFWKCKGADGLAFAPIIAFGANSSMPHYRAGNAALQKRDTVLLDIGVTLQHYHSDMTRTLFFGSPQPKMAEIYDIVQEAHKAALALCSPGKKVGELDAAARDLIAAKGYGDKFTHSLGHGLGLEVHEKPILRNKAPYKDWELLPGMVITIEPGIYLPGIGGVRIEDTILITQNGHENLTRACR